MVLVGKSLGTLALSYLLGKGELPSTCKLVWLTPLIEQKELRKNLAAFKGRSLAVIGTADHHYDPQALAEVKALKQVDVFEIEGADHGLQLAGDTISSLILMEKILSRMKKFIEEKA
jgi:predicted alpha/beta-hydrolase family hydrolase